MDNDLTRKIIAAAIEVHRTLGGPGLLENFYEAALCHELKLMGLKVNRQLPLQVMYKGFLIKEAYVIDLIVNDEIIIEVKSSEKNHSIYDSQLLTYLRLSGKKLGLVINFGHFKLVDGLSRIVNNV